MLNYGDLEIGDVYDCDCCGNLEKGYLEYLVSINEINGLIYLTVHNYNVMNSYMKEICYN